MEDRLVKRFPWLKVRTTLEDYVAPAYYDKLLKDYIFDGLTDVQHFARWAQGLGAPARALELGCGTGRVTAVALERLAPERLDVVDLSTRMLDHTKRRFSSHANVGFVHSDSIRFLERCRRRYDVIFSLWSLSHSIHQHLIQDGLEAGSARVTRAVRRMIASCLTPGGRFFLIHFDSQSDEQRILMRQWAKVYPLYRGCQGQSPSKELLDSTLGRLEEEGGIRFTATHHVGRPIRYASLDEALEIFLNFHMESAINGGPLACEAIQEMTDYFADYRNSKGEVTIAPGCFIYDVEKADGLGNSGRRR